MNTLRRIGETTRGQASPNWESLCAVAVARIWSSAASTLTEPALSYTNLDIRGAGKIKLFDIGRQLKVPLELARVSQDKRKKPREHVKLEGRKV